MPKVRQNESYLGFLSYLRHFVLSGKSSTEVPLCNIPACIFSSSSGFACNDYSAAAKA